LRYWDASALVPLVITEPSTQQMRDLISEDSSVVTWAWTWVEVASAVERRVREGLIPRPQRRTVLDGFNSLAEACDEVTDIQAVRQRAMTLLGRHPLRAADAAQLAAALLIAPADPSQLTFVCLDSRLAEAAEGEGLRVSPAM
jgi:predicted nucleic acid-binding protein